MFIAHLPAGYLLARAPVIRHLDATPLILAGAIIPDLDLLWFYFVDAAQAHHHTYLTHRPKLWLGILICGFVWRSNPKLTAFWLGGLLHMALDSMAGAINWGWPFASLPVTMIEVPATHDWWVLSFLTHPSFMIEIAICCAAALVFWRAPRKVQAACTSPK